MFVIDKDTTPQTEGVWTKFGEAEFKIRHISNLDFQRCVLRLQQPYKRKIDNGTLDPSVSKDIICKAMGTYVLVDWKRVGDKSGAELAFSPELSYSALLNNEDLREFVSTFSMNLDNYQQEELANLGKG